MRKCTIIAAAALLLPSIAAAQQKPTLEIGTYAGLSIQRVDFAGQTETFTAFEVPQLGLYTAFFPSNNVFIQPELSFTRLSGGDDTATGLGLAVSPAWAFGGHSVNSFYLAPVGVIDWFKISDDDDGVTDYAAGAKGGYRVLIADALAARFEVAYLRQFPEFGEESDLFMIRIGIGGVLHGSASRTAAR